jgi:hypothetical protein
MSQGVHRDEAKSAVQALRSNPSSWFAMGTSFGLARATLPERKRLFIRADLAGFSQRVHP